MENESVLRVGIVGCGYQGGILAQAVRKSQSFRWWHARTRIERRQRDWRRIQAAPRFLNLLSACWLAARIDVVFVATPHHLLAPASLAAIRAGKHVLGEKPVGLTEAEAVQIQEAAGRARVCFEAGYSFRYLPPGSAPTSC